MVTVFIILSLVGTYFDVKVEIYSTRYQFTANMEVNVKMLEERKLLMVIQYYRCAVKTFKAQLMRGNIS